ncbi:MAG: zinc ribbon domain-containing protein [Verrucomicrobia bacterium]|nr:zinc ribbon domain-containing protein [Verrucomicrobiota bacterium]
MPTYDYECQKCGTRFEVVQSMNDPKLEACPDAACDGRVKRLLGTGAGIIFKGSGFYQTDYRSSSYQTEAKAASGATKSETAPTTETAPAASTTPAPAAPVPKTSESGAAKSAGNSAGRDGARS